jgi:hypothetical protein
MSNPDIAANGAGPGTGTPTDSSALQAAREVSPNQRAWARFRRNKLGHASLWLFILLLVVFSKTEKKESDLGILSFPNFKVKNIATKNCNIDFKTIKQHHKFSNLNFNINSSKEKDNLQMEVNELSLIYQDTITIALKLNKLLINDQKEYHLKNLAIDTLKQYRMTLVDNSYLLNIEYNIQPLEFHQIKEKELNKSRTFVELWSEIAKQL